MFPLRMMKSNLTKRLTHKTKLAQMQRLQSKTISRIIQMTYQVVLLQSEVKYHQRTSKRAKKRINLKFQMWKARRRLRKLQTLNLPYSNLMRYLVQSRSKTVYFSAISTQLKIQSFLQLTKSHISSTALAGNFRTNGPLQVSSI